MSGSSYEYACTVCGSVGKVIRSTKGSFLIEIVLWFFFIIPGLIYSIWRLTSKKWVCSSCGSESVVPTTSPVGKKILEKYK